MDLHRSRLDLYRFHSAEARRKKIFMIDDHDLAAARPSPADKLSEYDPLERYLPACQHGGIRICGHAVVKVGLTLLLEIQEPPGVPSIMYPLGLYEKVTSNQNASAGQICRPNPGLHRSLRHHHSRSSLTLHLYEKSMTQETSGRITQRCLNGMPRTGSANRSVWSEPSQNIARQQQLYSPSNSVTRNRFRPRKCCSKADRGEKRKLLNL
jgi:hypothetical protein